MIHIVDRTTILSLKSIFLLDTHSNELMNVPLIWDGVVVNLKS
jgi:hypothetical protein